MEDKFALSMAGVGYRFFPMAEFFKVNKTSENI